jgi:hypothetical protein
VTKSKNNATLRPIPPAQEYRVQREDQGAPDALDPQAQGEFGTARKAAKRLAGKTYTKSESK